MRNIYYGDRGTLVEYAQLALDRAGYPTAVDGIFGEETCRSLQNFLGQDQECLVNQNTWSRLETFLKGYVREENDRLQVFEFPLVPGNVNYSSILVSYIVDGLSVRYPFLEQGSIGRSVMGKPIYYIKIGRGETEVFYNASFHANESITTPVLLKFLEEYARAYQQQMDFYGIPVQELYQNYSLYIVPMVNPDGVDLVNGILQNGAYYRQAASISADYPQIPFPQGWKANIEGIDLNLQFPAGWENARSIKYAQGFDKPAPRDYVGTAPLTAPESEAIYRFTLEHDFRLILAYHTQGRVIYWKYLNYEPVDSYQIAIYFGEVSGYAVEETPSESGYAGYKDWFIQEYNRPGYTIEVGEGENPLPTSQFARIYEENTGILMGGMTQVSDG